MVNFLIKVILADFTYCGKCNNPLRQGEAAYLQAGTFEDDGEVSLQRISPRVMCENCRQNQFPEPPPAER